MRSVTCPGCGTTKPEDEWDADVVQARNHDGVSIVDVGFRCPCGEVWGHDILAANRRRATP